MIIFRTLFRLVLKDLWVWLARGAMFVLGACKSWIMEWEFALWVVEHFFKRKAKKALEEEPEVSTEEKVIITPEDIKKMDEEMGIRMDSTEAREVELNSFWESQEDSYNDKFDTEGPCECEVCQEKVDRVVNKANKRNSKPKKTKKSKKTKKLNKGKKITSSDLMKLHKQAQRKKAKRAKKSK